MSKPHVVILGGGPAGVGAAYRLRMLDRAEVTVIEQRDVVGGNAGSFLHGEHWLDYGSHRLHPACDPEILAEIKALLGNDLLDRPRHGRILLRGKWIHFPLKPVDLALRLDRRFALGTVRDMLLPRRAPTSETATFASVLRAKLGATICEDFYFPYARKIWGRDPGELSAIQAQRRVSASSFGKLLRKVLGQVPGVKKPAGTGRFFYPRRGFGQISEAFATAAQQRGAILHLGWRVEGLERGPSDWNVRITRSDEERDLRADVVWSTIPVTLLARMVNPPPPEPVLEASGRISYRAMILVYLELDVDRFTEFDAHYFPGETVALTRLSEPKNYAARREPAGRTVLCAELPCDAEDAHWKMSDEALADRVAGDLATAGLPLPVAPRAVVVRRLRQAYPIYLTGYEEPFGLLDRWAEGVSGLLTYGRQGLFAHDNTHHALYMAFAAADCLTDAGFDRERWREYRDIFSTHVVED